MVRMPAIPTAMFLLPAETGTIPVTVAVLVPVGATALELIPDWLEMIVNEAPEHDDVVTAERVMTSFIDEGGGQALQVIVDSVAASVTQKAVEALNMSIKFRQTSHPKLI